MGNLVPKGTKYEGLEGIREIEPADESTNSGPVYRARDTKELSVSFDPNVKTQWDLLKYGVTKFKDNPMFGTRDTSVSVAKAGEFKWKTYQEVYELVKQCASGLKALDLVKPDATGDMKLLGLCGVNREEWVIAEFATFALGGTTVPFYATYTADQFAFALGLTELQTVVCMNEVAERLLEAKGKNENTKLQNLVVFDEFSGDEAKYEAAAIKILTFQEVMKAGKDSPIPEEELGKECTPDTIFSFVWTSGTTGNPKGALITQKSMIANLAGFIDDFGKAKDFELTEKEVYFSYLPIAHAMERTIFSMILTCGARVGFFRGAKEYILEDLKELRPTVFVSVPRLLNKIYDKLIAGVNKKGGIAAKLFNDGLKVKTRNLKKGYLKHGFYDKIFKKVKAKVGLDRVRLMATGSAPIAAHVLDFYRAVFSCYVIEGYGQTEVTCVATAGEATDFTAGHVGRPASCADVKLVSVPEMDYLVTDKEHGKEDNIIKCNGRGEICVRGPSTLKEYYRNPEKTKETLDEQGFVHTGDIGLWLPEGRLKIIDRKKNIFKLSQGEYIAPEKIEGIVCKNPLIAQAFVHGDSLQSQVVAVLYPDPEQLIPWAIKHSLADSATKLDDLDALKTLVAKKEVNEHLLKVVTQECRDAKAFSYEIPKAVFITGDEFSQENTLLTDTFKLKRNVGREVFKEEIENMYKTLGAITN